MAVSAGQLDQRVAIQTEARVSDGVGGYEVTWSTTATVWAMVKPVRGREQMEAQQLQASAMYRITIRNRPVGAAQRIVWVGKVLNIREAPDPGGRAQFREILAEEGVAV